MKRFVVILLSLVGLSPAVLLAQGSFPVEGGRKPARQGELRDAIRDARPAPGPDGARRPTDGPARHLSPEERSRLRDQLREHSSKGGKP